MAPGSRQRGRPTAQLRALRPGQMRDLPRSPHRYEVRLDSTLRRPGSSALHSATSVSCWCHCCHHHGRFPRTATWRWRLAGSYTPGEPSVTSDGDRRGKRATLAALFPWTPRFETLFQKFGSEESLHFFFPDSSFKKIFRETIGRKRNIFQSPSNE